MAKIAVLFLFGVIFACSSSIKNVKVNTLLEKASIDSTLTAWHNAAAQANFDEYFGLMADSSIFMGTDATEYWTKSAFMDYSRPYFEKGKAWTFYASTRRIFLDEYGNLAWFDEELITQNLGPCRGSGILKKKGNTWKIEHYNLSIPIPNELVRKVVNDIKTYHEKHAH